jgi:hypothetical protein
MVPLLTLNRYNLNAALSRGCYWNYAALRLYCNRRIMGLLVDIVLACNIRALLTGCFKVTRSDKG